MSRKMALDVLSEKEKDLKRHTYKGIRELSLFRPEVSVVYYYLTTLYFESEMSGEGSTVVEMIKRRGYP